jgi:hypothetical protein
MSKNHKPRLLWNYIQRVTKDAPQSRQVADRWNLFKNLRDALRKRLDQKYSSLKAVRNEIIESVPNSETVLRAIEKPRHKIRRLNNRNLKR